MKSRGLAVFAVCLVSAYAAPAKTVDLDPEAPSEPQEPVVYAPPKVIATVVGSGEVWVGQKLEVEISLYRDERLPNPGVPDFQLPEVSGAIVVEGFHPAPMVERENGVSYIVHKRTYLVFPQQDGTIRLPPLTASWQEPDDAPPMTVRSDEMAFKAFSLPGNLNPSETVVTPALSVSQTVEGDVDRFEVGGAITRIIHIRAIDTDAVMIPPMVFDDVAGMTRYAAEPEVRVSSNRGVYTAERIEKVTYIAEKWGWYTLPEIGVWGFDPTSRRARKATVEPVRFRARANFALGLSSFGDPISNMRTVLIVAVLMLVAGGAGYRLRRAFKNRKASSVHAATDTERVRFKAALNASRGGTPIDLINTVYRWVGFAPAHPSTTLHEIGRHHRAFSDTFDAIQSNAFSKEGNETVIASVAAVLTDTRKKELATRKTDAITRDNLNPVS